MMSFAMAANSFAGGETQADLRHKSAHLLQNGVLRVEIMDPTNPDRYCQGLRFSSVANVLRVTMNGKDFLFSPVEHNPQTDACGLATEFDIGKATKPPGFLEAAIGQDFIKIGVGVLRKNEETYAFFKSYDLIEAAPTQVTWAANSACFKQVCAGANGYAYQLVADVVLKANVLEVDYALTNSGSKPIITEQYAHNFFSFDGAVIGPDYVVQFPCDYEVKGLKPEQEQKAREIDFSQPISPHVKAINSDVTISGKGPGDNEVTIVNPANAISVVASVNRPLARMVIHATPRYLCPEQFVVIDVQPGGTEKWSRRYEFRDGSPKQGTP